MADLQASNITVPFRLPKDISRDDVLKAIADLDHHLVHKFGASTKYDLIHEGKRYPPKAVIGLAARRILGRPLESNEFSGGIGSWCFNTLEGLGFKIVAKDGASPNGQTPGPVPDYPTTNTLLKRFQEFRNDPVEALRIKVRRRRAAELRSLLSDPETVDLQTFNREVWVISEPRRPGEDRSLFERLFGAGELADDERKQLDIELLHDPKVQLHGNWLWRTATAILNPSPKSTDSQRLAAIRETLRILNDVTLPPVEKAKRIDKQPGFGQSVATGLVMVFHPTEFAVCNGPSQAALAQLGFETGPLDAFEQGIAELRLAIGADDFIELDWFLYSSAVRNKQPAVAAQVWWVNQGDSYEEAREAGRISCPLKNAKGAELAHWTNLTKSATGDVILHYSKGAIRAVGRAAGPAQTVQEAESAGKTTDRYVVPVEYRELTDPVPLDRIPSDWRTAEGGPFTRIGAVQQGYLFPISPEFFQKLVVRFPELGGGEPTSLDRYTVDNALSGAFISRAQFEAILAALHHKKNVVLQGPPGVGKTYLARRLAYALIGAKNPAKVRMIQFHQSYAYEDFVQGWRPTPEGGFERKDGVFYDFCNRAKDDPDSAHVFVIDEINRGNLSRIMGEMMMLVEADKRGPDFAVPLTYARSGEQEFYVPPNVYLLGLMNTADRSLAMVDYALRRRFVFFDLKPQFQAAEFRDHLTLCGATANLIERIVSRLATLNETIAKDTKNLGPGFAIGHSFFCSATPGQLADEAWYESVIVGEVAPLVREYWFDQPTVAQKHIDQLLAPATLPPADTGT